MASGNDLQCPQATSCPLYSMFRDESALGIWKVMYCRKGFEKCERYRATQAGQVPPDDMLPNGKRLDTGPPKPGG